jgi:alpha-amylase
LPTATRPTTLAVDQSGDPLVHGYLPTDKGYYHGGDLAGLAEKLDYLEDLGVTAIWLSPPFTNRWVQGDGTVEGSSAGYHGYWQLDFTQIDPHFGTNAEMITLIQAAHAREMKVFFDVILNHTADVISYAGGHSATAARPISLTGMRMGTFSTTAITPGRIPSLRSIRP